MTDDDKNVNEINWVIHDLFGSTVLSSTTGHGSAGTSFVRGCLDMNSCYTFTIHSDLRRYRVEYDGEILKSSDESIMGQTVMFGGLCLQNGETACSSTSSTIATTSPSLSMFRLELAVDNGSGIVWTLIDSSTQNVIRSAGPYTNCDVNTLALCLPRDKCYEFIISDNSLDQHTDKGIFTVMFSHHDNDMVQHYTGVVNGQHVVLLGTCYE
jgi:hypothetical protein